MKKLLAGLLVLAAFGWLLWEIYDRTSAPTGGPRRGGAGPVAFEVVPIRKAVIRDVRRLTGSVLARSQFQVAPKIAGRLEKLMVDIGDEVHNRQLIAQLDSDEYVQQVAQAEAELEMAKANVVQASSNLELARKKLARYRALYEKKVASQSEIEVVEAEYKVQEAAHKVAEARVLQNKAALEAAKVQEAYTKISASWENGEGRRVVGERFVDEGAMLKANEPIVSIIDIASVTAVIYVIERDYGKIRIGQEARVTTDALPGESFRSRVVRVAPLLKEASRQARVELEIPNPKGSLKPGMFVRVEIEFIRLEDVTVVPAGSVVKRNDTDGVFIVDTENMKVRFVPVKLGLEEEDMVQVLEPNLSGSVVTMGQHLLEDGRSIKLPGTESEDASPRQDAQQTPPAGRGGSSGGRQ